MSPIVIRLAGQPRGKGRARAVATRGGFARVHPDPKSVKYETQLAYAATQVMDGRPPLDGPLEVLIVSMFPIPQGFSKAKRAAAIAGTVRPTVKPDFDNIAKLVDGLNQIVWLDDKQIVDGRVVKHYSETPGMTIQVTEFQG